MKPSHKRFSTLVREAKQMRITREKLRQRIERLQKAGFDIEIGWAYGQPRVTNKSESRDLSPRLPMSAMNEWIDGFERGAIELPLHLAIERMRECLRIKYGHDFAFTVSGSSGKVLAASNAKHGTLRATPEGTPIREL